MLPLRVILVQRINNYLQVFFIAQEIGIGGIHKKRFHIVLSDVVRIGFLYAKEVIVGDALFVGPVPLFNILLQLLHRRMQVDQQFWLHQLLVDDLEESLVQTEFVFRQVDLGKEQALGKKIIRYGQVLKKIFLLYQFLELLEPFCHEKQFQRESILGRFFQHLCFLQS